MRRSLDLDMVLDGAERIIAAEGIDALSMRRLGAELNISFSGLYVYVSGRDDLLLGLIARKLSAIMPTLRATEGLASDHRLESIITTVIDMLRMEAVARTIGREIGGHLLDGHDRDPELLVEFRGLLTSSCIAWAKDRMDAHPAEIGSIVRGIILTTIYDSHLGTHDQETWRRIRERMLVALRSAATA